MGMSVLEDKNICFKVNGKHLLYLAASLDMDGHFSCRQLQNTNN